jgi:hypothetical protein
VADAQAATVQKIAEGARLERLYLGNPKQGEGQIQWKSEPE